MHESVLLAKDTIEPAPPADMGSGLYSRYFIVPKKSGGLLLILDLRVLNRALHKLPFKMLTQKRIFGCVWPLDWFAYFHCPRSSRDTCRSCDLRSRVGHISTRSCPSGCPLSPRVFTKVAEAALAPLREWGVCILNYLDDWLILEQLCANRDLGPHLLNVAQKSS